MVEKKKKTQPAGRTATGQEAEKIDVKPTDASIRETAVVSFGRFNPPTKGHGRLVERAKQVADIVEGDLGIYLSHSFDAKKNPLDYDTKMELCTEAFGEHFIHAPYKNIFEVLQSLTGFYKNVYIVLGEDRAEATAERLAPYLGELFDFETLEVLSVERDEHSSSKARGLVEDEDFAGFVEQLPEAIQDAAFEIFESIRHNPVKDYIWVSYRDDDGKLQWRKKYRHAPISEMTSDRMMRYIDKAAKDRGKAEHEGDEKRMKKRTKGVNKALDVVTDRINQGKD